MEQMTPQEALQVFDQLAGQIQTDRASHQRIAQAIIVLQKLVDSSAV